MLPDAVKAAREAAGRSMVLLKNEGSTLPLKKDMKTAVIGPLAKTATPCSARGGAGGATRTP